MTKARITKIMLLLPLVWVFLVVLGYYVFHKPVNLQQAQALGSGLLNIAIAGAVTIFAGGIGRLIYQNKSLHSGELVVAQAVLGYGILSLSWLLIGLLGGFNSTLAWLLLVAGMVILRRYVSSWVVDALNIYNGLNLPTGFTKALGISIVLMIFFQLIRALGPPTAWDTLMYHLELPKQYLELNRFQFIQDNFYWGQPQLSEMLFTFSGALYNWQTATTLNWFMLTLFLTGVIATVRNYSTSGALVAVASLLVGETFRFTMYSGYVDGISALFGYALFVVLLSWESDQNVRQVSWIGIFLGLAAWVKLTNLILFPIVTISLILINIRRSNSIWKGGKSLLVGLIVFLPWLLILWGFTGNPIYPHYFPAPGISALRYQFFQAQGANPGFDALWLPIAMTLYGLHTNFFEGKIVFATDIGPLLVSFGVLGVFFAIKEKKGPLLITWVLAGWIFMIMGGLVSELLWQTRLYFVLLTPLAILVGLGWKKAVEFEFSKIRLKMILGAMVILVVVLSGFTDMIGLVSSESVDVVVGTMTEEDYLSRNLGGYYQASRHLGSLSDTSRILLLWEPRGFYLPGNAQSDVWIDRWYVMTLENDEASEILDHWLVSGTTHLLINLNGMEYERENNQKYSYQQWLLLDKFLEELPEPLKIGNQYALYALD
jgi:hypothetical protein